MEQKTEQKLAHYIVTAAIAILHNGKRYEQGDQMALTPEEAADISLYIQLDETENQRQAEKTEQERLKAEAKAEQAQRKAAEKQKEKEKHTEEKEQA